MKIMKAEEFAQFLRKLADAVESGDSLEGSLQYTYAEWPYQDHGMKIDAAVRTGNRDGQGGMLLL